MKNLVLNLIFFVAFTACSKKSTVTGEDGEISGQKYISLNSSAIVFKKPLGEISSHKNFSLTFIVDDQEGLRFISYSDNKLQNGAEIIFTRNGQQLQVQKIIKGEQSAPKLLNGINANSSISLQIDVHNNEANTHILIWTSSETNPTEDNAIFNSEVDSDISGKGEGAFWGFVFTQSKVTDVFISDAKFTH